MDFYLFPPRCGEAVCRTHFGTTIKLNENAVPNVSGIECEVCDDCFLTSQRRILKSAGLHIFPKSRETFLSSFFFFLLLFFFLSSLVLPFSHILLEPKERPLLFVSPVFPGSEEEETPILQAIRVHLKEGVFYFNRVRTELSEMNNSVTKRDYLLSEKARFDQTLNATIEAENLVHVFARDFFGTHTPYLQECLAQLDIMKEWAGSSEIFLLRSGKATLLRTIGRILSKTPKPQTQFPKQ